MFPVQQSLIHLKLKALLFCLGILPCSHRAVCAHGNAVRCLLRLKAVLVGLRQDRGRRLGRLFSDLLTQGCGAPELPASRWNDFKEFNQNIFKQTLSFNYI